MQAALPDGTRGKLLALALTATGAALLWLGCVQPLAAWYDQRAEAIEQRRALLRRMETLAATLPALRQQASNDRPAVDALINGSSDPIASAMLQTTIQGKAARAGATLASVETLPAEARGKYRRIGLRISLSDQWPVLVEVMRSILQSADGTPDMVMDNLQFHAPPLQTRTAGSPVNAAFTVFAFRAANPGEGG
jgi:general secretion pathway protein M